MMELGKLEIILGNYDMAKKCFDYLLRTKSSNNQNYAILELGKLDILFGDYDSAREKFNGLLDTNNRRYAIMELGKLERELGNYSEARFYFNVLLNGKNDKDKKLAMKELNKLDLLCFKQSKNKLVRKLDI